MIRFVVNPIAGKGAGAAAIPRIERAMSDLGASFDVRTTSRPGEAVALAEEAAAEGVPLVVAVGGDGTVHEVANGLLAGGTSHSALGVVPVGSGNDWARTIGVPTDVAAACARLVEGKARRLDVARVIDLRGPVVRPGLADREIVVNGLGIGLTASVVLEARRLRRLTGLPLYVTALLRTILLHYRSIEASVRLDERELTLPVVFAELCNGQWEGGGFHTAPDAKLDDGLIDVVALRRTSRLRFLQLVPRVLEGTHVTSPRFELLTTRRVAVELARPSPVQADGEILAEAATHVEVEAVPGALSVVV